MSQASKVGAIIVTYNSGAVVGRCIQSCMAQGMEVVVVDNASQDDSVSHARTAGARVIANPGNLGFGAAANQGCLALSDCVNCVLLINPDVEITSPTAGLSGACLEHGASCGMLQDIEGQPQTGFQLRRLPTAATLAFEVLGINRLWKNNPVNRAYRYLDADFATPAFVEQPAGAFLMIRRNTWMAVGGFDERFYPVWFEDVDLCKRLMNHGVKVAYVPKSTGTHMGGHSVRKMPYSSRMTAWYGSLLRYSCKHFSSVGRRVVAAAVFTGTGPRCIAGIFEQRSLGPVAVWWSISSKALSVLWGGAEHKAVS